MNIPFSSSMYMASCDSNGNSSATIVVKSSSAFSIKHLIDSFRLEIIFDNPFFAMDVAFLEIFAALVVLATRRGLRLFTLSVCELETTSMLNSSKLVSVSTMLLLLKVEASAIPFNVLVTTRENCMTMNFRIPKLLHPKDPKMGI